MAAIDLRKLGPADLCRLVNSTAAGPVLTERRLARHRNDAGLRVGSGRHVDLIRYTAWLVSERHKPKPVVAKSDPYQKQKEAARKRSAEIFESGRDIAPLPEISDPTRRSACERDFRLFCETYFPFTFTLSWSDDHLQVIGQIETSVLSGGLFATAMPRGSGKTTLAECACIWAVVYGHRDFVCLIGSDEGRAAQMLDSIKTELEGNELLAEDFPEVCYPIERLEGIANRCNGQLCDGERTQIGWTAKEIVLPTIPGSKASGAIVKVAGITGGLRGMKFKRPDGRTVRPSLVVIDDPQTDESARSPSQCETRERILAGAILGLAGPGKKISGIMPCTVIRSGDMADSILNRDKHPEWNGTRTKMVYAFPSDEKLWEEYGRLRADSLRAGRGGKEATEFYAENREAMDAGARVAWAERYEHDELSAVQHAMNLRFRDERAFFAEYQNEPIPEVESRTDDLTPDQIASKLNRMPRGLIPTACGRLTAFIDVQGSMLFWLVAAWEDDFTGSIVDYGSFPDQKRAYFTLNDAKHTLGDTIKAKGLEGQIYGGLEQLTDQILGREWTRDDGALLRVEKCPIDANWGVSTETIYQFVRQSKYPTILVPSHGKYVGASAKPMREWQKKPGDRHGLNWLVPGGEAKRNVSRLIYDTNWWKSFIHTRLATAMGDRGCLSLFGDKPDTHRLLADHLTAEFRVRTTGRGRDVEEWKLRPGRPDNHWLDCLVGSAVAASLLGVALPETAATAPTTKRKRVTFAELMARRNAKAS